MDIDVKKTWKYYKSIATDDLCACNYCKNYYLQVRSAYPLVADYLASIGVDIQKPFETSPLEPDMNGILEYCACQYVVFGNCQGFHAHKMGNVELRIATSFPSTGIEDEHFVLELYPIRLKWIVCE